MKIDDILVRIDRSSVNEGISDLYCRLIDCKREIEKLRAALCMIYEKYEDGGQCFEGPDCDDSYMGNAVHLDGDEENQILALIPKERSATPNAEVKGGADE